MSQTNFAPTVVAVLPTTTDIAELAARDSIADLAARGGVAGAQVENMTVDQTLSVLVSKKAHPNMPYAPTGIGELLEIPPLESRYIELPIRGCSAVKLSGYYSGSGGSVRFSVRIA